MFDTLKPLLENGLLNEEARQEISEAWERQLLEAKEIVKAELREEYAQKYEHDKTVMVEALDRMVTEGLVAQIESLQAEKLALVEDRVKFQAKMRENSTKFNDFMVTKLAEEIGELRKDRKVHNEGLEKLESFIVHALAREIREFAQDKQDVVNTKVRLVREARSKLESLKARFIKESAQKMSKAVSRHLKAELNQLHEDIKVARENNFGRKIFEAYAAEFGATHLNESAEVRKLQAMIQKREYQLSESIRLNKKAKVLVESKDREIRIIKESTTRAQLMDELLSPLNEEKQGVMRGLLESVQTNRLKNAFEKYLPAVLDDRSAKPKKVITESITVSTGDKTVPEAPKSTDSNVIDLKRLAGL
jgi:hypothetical protein